MRSELGVDAKIPDLWRMSALLEMCPKDLKEQMLMRLDEVGENYEALTNKRMSFATNKIEQAKSAGPVAMDVDGVLEDWGNEEEDMWGESVDAVWPATRCYECGGYGHMAKGCPNKGKGKGKHGGKMGGGKSGGKNGEGKSGGMKGYGKSMTKGGGK